MAGRPIDEQIIKMTLDEAEFKRRAESTIGIFGRLNNLFGQSSKNAPMFDKSTASLDQLNYAANNTTMDKLLNAVDTVTNRFSVMGELANRILTNIAMKAIDVGTTLVKSLSVDQIMAGFSEYELKMGSIQTIQASTGESLESISGYLDELNTYADKTIYSFADMTTNIGKFTNAGVSLNDAVAAIQGISNAAAVSGANSNEASRAMYNFAQALSAGHVKLMDWKSIENANMATVEFKTQLLEAGVAAGTLSKQADGMYKVLTGGGMDETISATKLFNESLSDQWMTTDVLVSTLSDYADETTEIGAKAFAAAQDVKTFTQLVDTLQEAAGSGWAKTFELLVGDFDESKALWTSVNNVLSGIIDGMSDARNKLIEGFVDIGGRDAIISTISNLYQAGAQLVTIARNALQTIFPPVTAQQLLNLVNGLKDFTASLKLSESMAAKVSTIFKGVFSIFSSLWEITKRLGEAFADMLPEGLVSSLSGGFVDILVKVAEALLLFNQSLKDGNRLTSGLSTISSFVSTIVSGIVTMFSSISRFLTGSTDSLKGVGETLGQIVSFITTTLGKFFGSFTAGDLLNTGFIGVLAIAASKITKLTGPIEDILGAIKDMFSGAGEGLSIFGKLSESLSAFTGSVKVASLVGIALAVGTLAVSLKLLEGIDGPSIVKGLSALGTILGGLTVALGIITKMDLGIFKSAGIATVFIAMAGSIFVIAGALKLLASINPEEMSIGLKGLVSIVAVMTTSMALLSKVDRKGTGGSMQIVAMAGSLLVIATAVKSLSSIDAGGLTRSVTALAAVVAVMAGFVLLTEGTKMKAGTSTTLLSMAVSIKILVGAMSDIAEIPTDQLTKALITIGVLLGELALFSNLMSNVKMGSGAVGMVAMAVTLNLLVGPLEKFASMNGSDLSKGLITIAAGLGVMVLAMHGAQGAIAGAGAMVIMAMALNLMVIPIRALSSLNIQQVGIAMLALGGTIAIMAAAALLLVPALPAMLGLAGSIALVGAGVGLAALGLAALATGLVAISAAAPEVVTALELIIVGLADGIAKAAPAAINAIIVVIGSLLSAVRDNIGNFIMIAVDIIVAMANALGEGLPRLLTAAVDLVINVVNGMANAIREQGPQLVAAVFNLMGAILEIVVDTMIQLVDILFGWIPGVEGVAQDLGIAAKEGLREIFGTGEIGAQGAQEFADGIAGVSAAGAGTDIADSAVGGMLGPDTEGAGTTKGDEFVRGVSSQSINANSAGRNVSQQGRNGASSVSWFSTGASAVSGFVSGIWGNIKSVYSAGVSMAEQALSAVKTRLDSHSPSREMIPEGANFVMGMVKGISNNTKYAASAAGNMASKAMDTAKSYVDTFMDVLSQDIETNPVVKPVLDLSNIDKNSLQFTPTSLGTSGVSIMKDMMNYINPKREVVQEERTVDTKDTNKPIVINFNNPIVESKEAVQELTREAMLEADRLLGRFISQSKGGRSIA